MEKYICFRFDVDTHICLTKGVPNLLRLFKTYDARCTFFVSMGSAFDRWLFVKQKIKNRFYKTNSKGIFSMAYKLGFVNSVAAIIINPRIGSGNKVILHNIITDNHEIGLHGGKNHAAWEQGAKNWNTEKVKKEIEYGLNCFKRLALPKPLSFASPCWQSPKQLDKILSKTGF